MIFLGGIVVRGCPAVPPRSPGARLIRLSEGRVPMNNQAKSPLELTLTKSLLVYGSVR